MGYYAFYQKNEIKLYVVWILLSENSKLQNTMHKFIYIWVYIYTCVHTYIYILQNDIKVFREW